MGQFDFRKVQNFIDLHGMFSKTDLVLVAVSGGSDSLGTLLVLHAMGYNVHATGVDHGLRSEAKSELELVQSICMKRKIGFIPLRIEMDGSRNIQAVARQKRYEAMLNIKQQFNAKALVTGHTRNDQVETYMMACLRGKGMHACGIQPVRQDGVMRPMLKVDRQKLRTFLRSESVTWVEDPSNQNTKYERVKARNICQKFEEINPLAFNHLDEHIDAIGDMNGLVKDVAVKVFDQVVKMGVLDLNQLSKERPCIQNAVISLFLGRNPGRNVLLETRKLTSAQRGRLRVGNKQALMVVKGKASLVCSEI